MHALKAGTAQNLFYLYAGLTGLSLSYVLAFTGVSVVRTFGDGGFFGALSLYGYTTKRDLSGMACSCLWGWWV